MNIQLLFNPSELSWGHTLLSGLVGAIIGGFISGIITFIAMKIIDNENKKRWEQDGFQKTKLDLMLSVISLLADMQIHINTTRNYTRIKDMPSNNKAFVEESEQYKELYNHISKLSVFYKDDNIFDNIALELRKLIYLSKGIEIIFENKTCDVYLDLYGKGIISFSYNQPYINYYQYFEYRKEQEALFIDNQTILKGYKNAEEFSNSMQNLLYLMENLYGKLLEKVPQDKL